MITQLLTAKEAAEISRKELDKKLEVQIIPIAEAITKAASNGEFAVDIKQYLTAPIRTYLQNQGYNLKDWREYNEEYVTISWKEN